jgi:hypothetical protein
VLTSTTALPESPARISNLAKLAKNGSDTEWLYTTINKLNMR